MYNCLETLSCLFDDPGHTLIQCIISGKNKKVKITHKSRNTTVKANKTEFLNYHSSIPFINDLSLLSSFFTSTANVSVDPVSKQLMKNLLSLLSSKDSAEYTPKSRSNLLSFICLIYYIYYRILLKILFQILEGHNQLHKT